MLARCAVPRPARRSRAATALRRLDRTSRWCGQVWRSSGLRKKRSRRCSISRSVACVSATTVPMVRRSCARRASSDIHGPACGSACPWRAFASRSITGSARPSYSASICGSSSTPRSTNSNAEATSTRRPSRRFGRQLGKLWGSRYRLPSIVATRGRAAACATSRGKAAISCSNLRNVLGRRRRSGPTAAWPAPAPSLASQCVGIERGQPSALEIGGNQSIESIEPLDFGDAGQPWPSARLT